MERERAAGCSSQRRTVSRKANRTPGRIGGKKSRSDRKEYFTNRKEIYQVDQRQILPLGQEWRADLYWNRESEIISSRHAVKNDGV